MSKKPKQHKVEPSLQTHNEMRKDIALQTKDFLRMGGTIQRVPNGASGLYGKTHNYSKLPK